MAPDGCGAGCTDPAWVVARASGIDEGLVPRPVSPSEVWKQDIFPVIGAQSRIRTRSLRLLRTARLPFSPSGLGSSPWTRTKNIRLLRASRLPIAPASHSFVVEREGVEPSMNLHTRGLQPRALPLGHRSTWERQYESRDRKVVWVAGFEPAASAFQARPSTGLTIHPGEVAGRGRFMVLQ